MIHLHYHDCLSPVEHRNPMFYEKTASLFILCKTFETVFFLFIALYSQAKAVVLIDIWISKHDGNNFLDVLYILHPVKFF